MTHPPRRPQRSRRDRHGRGLRSRLVPNEVPLARSRAEQFDDLVLDAVEDIERRWERELAGVEFAVEDVPWVEHTSPDEVVLDADVLDDGSVPLARVLPGAPGERHRGPAAHRRLPAAAGDPRARPRGPRRPRPRRRRRPGRGAARPGSRGDRPHRLIGTPPAMLGAMDIAVGVLLAVAGLVLVGLVAAFVARRRAATPAAVSRRPSPWTTCRTSSSPRPARRRSARPASDSVVALAPPRAPPLPPRRRPRAVVPTAALAVLARSPRPAARRGRRRGSDRRTRSPAGTATARRPTHPDGRGAAAVRRHRPRGARGGGHGQLSGADPRRRRRRIASPRSSCRPGTASPPRLPRTRPRPAACRGAPSTPSSTPPICRSPPTATASASRATSPPPPGPPAATPSPPAGPTTWSSPSSRTARANSSSGSAAPSVVEGEIRIHD